MKHFKSQHSYEKFSGEVKIRNRFIYSKDTKEFLDTVLSTARDREERLPEGAILWRARRGHSCRTYDDDVGEIPTPYKKEEMKPPTDGAKEGRLNPKGIPCLYLSTDKATAVDELRPGVGEIISVAQFKLIKELLIINCIDNLKQRVATLNFKEPPEHEKEVIVWKSINRAFSAPVERSDDVADYTPTQILAELFRQNGYDGVAFRSSQGNGHNVALFNLQNANPINCVLVNVKSISREIEDYSQIVLFKQ